MDLSRNDSVTNSENPQVVSSSRPIRERVGLIVDGANAAAAVKTIVAAEAAGVRQIWMAQPPNLPDALTTFAAAAANAQQHWLYKILHLVGCDLE